MSFSVGFWWFILFYLVVGLGWGLSAPKHLPEFFPFSTFGIIILWPVHFLVMIDQAIKNYYEKIILFRLPIVSILVLWLLVDKVAELGLWGYFVNTFYAEGFGDFLVDFVLIISSLALFSLFLFYDFFKRIRKKY